MKRILPVFFVIAVITGLIAAEEIEGTWDFIYQTSDGSRRVVCAIELEGEKLTIVQRGLGKMVGTYQDRKFSVELTNYYSQELGLTADVKLEGSLAEGRINGKWEFDAYSGTFSAQRSGS